MPNATNPTTNIHSIAGLLRPIARIRFVVALSLILGILSACRPSLVDQPHPAIGTALGAIELLPLESSPGSDMPPLVQQVPPGVVVLHFWGTWCGPCRMEYPELSEMVAGFQSSDRFHFLSISTENSADATYQTLAEETFAFFDEHGIDHSVYCDPRGETRETIKAALGSANLYFPTTILIDANGRVADVWEGYDPAGVAQMRKAIESQLSS